MVYQKSDGSFGFSWQQQYDFLLKEHPEDLESIVQSKFSLLKGQEPEKAEYYEELEEELARRIAEAWDKNPNFGYQESDEVVLAFIKDEGLEELFSDVPTLLIAEDEEYECEDELLDDRDFGCDDLEHYLGKYEGKKYFNL